MLLWSALVVSADVLNGTACLRVGTVQRLAALLDGPLPAAPRHGHGEAGDITVLAHLSAVDAMPVSTDKRQRNRRIRP